MGPPLQRLELIMSTLGHLWSGLCITGGMYPRYRFDERETAGKGWWHYSIYFFGHRLAEAALSYMPEGDSMEYAAAVKLKINELILCLGHQLVFLRQLHSRCYLHHKGKTPVTNIQIIRFQNIWASDGNLTTRHGLLSSKRRLYVIRWKVALYITEFKSLILTRIGGDNSRRCSVNYCKDFYSNLSCIYGLKATATWNTHAALTIRM